MERVDQRQCPSCKRIDGWVKTSADKVYNCSYCSNVNLIDDQLMHYQLRIVKDNSNVHTILGGYGSGKTFASAYRQVMIGLLVPEAKGMITSGSLTQLYTTIYQEMIKRIPPTLVQTNDVKKKTGGELLLTNGHCFQFVAPNEQTIRSANIIHAHIEEANGVSYDVFTQLTARMREVGNKGIFASTDERIKRNNMLMEKWTSLSITSNPEDSWVTDKVLLRSEKIDNYGTTLVPEQSDIIPGTYAQVTATRMNYHLKEEYIQSLAARYDTVEERKTYLEGDFTAKAGRVITDVTTNVYKGELHNMQKMVSVVGLDLGAGGSSGDPQAFLYGRISLVYNGATNKWLTHLWITDEIVSREQTRIKDWCRIYNKFIDGKKSKYFMGIYVDGIHSPKRYSYDNHDTSIFDVYEQNGLKGLKFSKNGKITILERVIILRDMWNSGRIHISDNCVELIKELKNYRQVKIIQEEKVSTKNNTAKFKGSDHCIDALTNILMEMETNELIDHKDDFERMLLMYDNSDSQYNYNYTEQNDLFFI